MSGDKSTGNRFVLAIFAYVQSKKYSKIITVFLVK